MFDFEKTCKKYEEMIFDERKAELESLSLQIIPELMKIPNGMEIFKILIKASCAADGSLQGAEYTLIASATGLDFGGFESMESQVNQNPNQIMKLADISVDEIGNLSEEIKEAMVSFCLCIVSADRRISLKEKSFIKKLIRI